MLLTFPSVEFDVLTVTNFKDDGLLGNDAVSLFMLVLKLYRIW